jgi:hypothetical protein
MRFVLTGQAVTGGAYFFLPPPKDSYGKTIKRQEINVRFDCFNPFYISF